VLLRKAFAYSLHSIARYACQRFASPQVFGCTQQSACLFIVGAGRNGTGLA
jgi:hypothetical protein